MGSCPCIELNSSEEHYHTHDFDTVCFKDDDFTDVKQIISDKQITNRLLNYIYGKTNEYDSNVIMSIFYIIYYAYCKHYDIMMTKDAILSQFFLLFGECENVDVFQKNREKTVIEYHANRNIDENKLKELPKCFVEKIDLSTIDIDIDDDNKQNVKNVVESCNMATNVAYMCALKERAIFEFHTMCKIPRFSINASKKEIKNIIKLMKAFIDIKRNPISDKTDIKYKKYRMLTKYVLLIEKIYDMHYKKIIDYSFFNDLVQKSNRSGQVVSGYINNLENAKDCGTVNIKRIIRGRMCDDLIYTNFLVCIPYENKKLLWTTAYSYPKNDSVIPHEGKHNTEKKYGVEIYKC